MKMSKEHVAVLLSAFRKLNAIYPIAAGLEDYRARGLSDMRFHWDCYWSAKGSGFIGKHWIVDVIYPLGLNDNHIHTALRHVVKVFMKEQSARAVLET